MRQIKKLIFDRKDKKMKLKKLLSFTATAVVALTALAGAMTVSADTVDSGTCGDLSWTLDSDGVLTFSGQGDMDSPNVDGKDYKKPETKNDYLDTYTYKSHKDAIKEVKIEEGATSIGFCAFYKLPNLVTVTLPSTIREFKGIEVQFVNSESGTAGSDWYQTMSYTFAECPLLKNLTLTEGITHIGGYAFNGCTSLDNVTIPKSITKWDAYSFSDCSSLKNVTLTDGLTTIGSYVFCNSALLSVFIPSSITNWVDSRSDYATFKGNANCAFENCKKLSSVTFEEGLKQIGFVLFANCSSLKKVVVPASVTDMRYSFENCTGLQEAYLEEGIQITDGNGHFQSAFAYCSNLKRIEIPAGIDIAYTNPQWLTGCSSLTDIYIHGKDYTIGIPDGGGTPKFHCYFNSTTYETLKNPNKSNIPEERLVNIEDEISAYKEIIQSRLDDAKSYDEAQYTPKSYGVLKALIERAEKYGDDSNIMEMQETASDIRAAIKALEKKPDEPATEPSSDDKSDQTNSSNNTSDSSNNTPTPPAKTEPTTAKTPVQNNINKPANKVPSTPKVTVTKPAKVKAVKLTAKKKKLNVKWKKVSGATGYEVMYATNNKFTKNKKTVKVKKNKVTLKRLKSKKKYYVKVRAYKKANGDTNYGKWSKVVKKKAK